MFAILTYASSKLYDCILTPSISSFKSNNNIAFQPLVVDKRYYDKLGSGVKNYGPMTSVEFICVHYAGNMAKGADADNNCDYFNNLGYEASIHFLFYISSKKRKNDE